MSEPTTATAATTIVVADDHEVVSSVLRLLLDAEPDLEVIAEAGDIPGAIHTVLTHRPAVMVLDLNMPGGSGLDVVTTLRASAPKTAIVVLTMRDDPAFARWALQNGSLAFVLKEAADEGLLAAGGAAARAQTYLTPRLGARMAREPASPPDPPDALTHRERDVLRRIALGHTNAEIAAHPHLSIRTGETHRAHIQHKLSRSSRAELVQYALEHDLVLT